MTGYDPLVGPDPNEWRALDEMEQVQRVIRYHQKAGIALPNERLHATIHSVVENQILLGSETPVAATLERLLAEGLNRHDAVHAIGMVLAAHIHDMLQGSAPAGDPTAPYYQELRDLTAQRWRDQAE